jgi:hypothetical protein
MQHKEITNHIDRTTPLESENGDHEADYKIGRKSNPFKQDEVGRGLEDDHRVEIG